MSGLFISKRRKVEETKDQFVGRMNQTIESLTASQKLILTRFCCKLKSNFPLAAFLDTKYKRKLDTLHQMSLAAIQKSSVKLSNQTRMRLYIASRIDPYAIYLQTIPELEVDDEKKREIKRRLITTGKGFLFSFHENMFMYNKKIEIDMKTLKEVWSFWLSLKNKTLLFVQDDNDEFCLYDDVITTIKNIMHTLMCEFDDKDGKATQCTTRWKVFFRMYNQHIANSDFYTPRITRCYKRLPGIPPACLVFSNNDKRIKRFAINEYTDKDGYSKYEEQLDKLLNIKMKKYKEYFETTMFVTLDYSMITLIGRDVYNNISWYGNLFQRRLSHKNKQVLLHIEKYQRDQNMFIYMGYSMYCTDVISREAHIYYRKAPQPFPECIRGSNKDNFIYDQLRRVDRFNTKLLQKIQTKVLVVIPETNLVKMITDYVYDPSFV
jgi:hypothetical protein